MSVFSRRQAQAPFVFSETVTADSPPQVHAPARTWRTDAWFWSSFFVLNALLFLPLYLLNLQEMSFLPPLARTAHSWRDGAVQLLSWRSNFDIFRVNVELLAIVALWSFVAAVRRRWVRALFVVFYVLLLSYYIYEAIVLSFWMMEPIFYNHYYMARNGVVFLLEGMGLSPLVYVGAALALLAVLAGINWLMRRALPAAATPQIGHWSRVVLAVLMGVGLLSLVAYRGVLAKPEMVFSSLGYKLDRNIHASLRLYNDAAAISDRTIRQAYDYSQYDLAETPNIYLIFVESYGSVLYKRDDYAVAYRELLDALEPRYEEAGWHVATTLSTSPTWGGGSWMAYTSAMFGLHIAEHPYYMTLFDQYQQLDYPDLATWLQEQGYTYYRASTLSKELNESMWDKYRNFYGVDEWIRYSDLNYVGQRYGWGPAPADQYVVNFARDRMEADGDGPHLFFYITQNSHFPWMPIPAVADDWRTINVPEDDQVVPSDDEIEHDQRRTNYLNSIDYELEYLTRFILERGTEDDIFVLVGDHQPPRVSRRDDGFETPMHIISRNPDFIAGLAEYGFTPGLHVDLASNEPLRHEGFFSMFARALLSTYGDDPDNLPPYLPKGVLLLTDPNAY